MDSFVKDLIERAKANGAKVEIIHVNSDEQNGEPEPQDVACEELKNNFDEIAKLNKMLFDAHIQAGFSKIEALKLTVAVISCGIE